MTGLVTDRDKAGVPNATVKLANERTKVVRSTRSNEVGVYAFEAVDPGSYTIKVNAAGFAALVTEPFDISASQTASIDVQMELGQANNAIQVSASSALLQTEAPVLGGSIAERSIVRLPIFNQNPVMLALNLPGVSSNRYSFGINTFSVNGARGRSNNFMIDGTENNDISIAGQGFQISNPDAVVEISVQTGLFDAEYGRSGGAIVNVITKSGTNEFHGDARYLIESTIFDAPTNLQKLSPAVLQRGHPLPGTDQFFSGAIGGPIRKNRTFFFSAYQEERRYSTSQLNLTTLSPAGRATLLSLFPKGANHNADILQQVTAGSDASSQFFPVSAGPGLPDIQFGTFPRPIPNHIKDHQLIERVDHNLGERDQLSGRYMIDDQLQPVGGNITFPGFDTSERIRNQNAVISETHTFSPSSTNEARLGYNRILLYFPVDAANPLASTLPLISIQGIPTNLGLSNNFPQGRIANNFEFQDTLSYVRGRHTFRVGTSLLDQRAKQAAPFNVRGVLGYGASTGYTGLANFFEDFGGSGGGAQRDFGTQNYYPTLFRQAYFAQDRWRVSPTVTLTLGLRYEYFGLPINSIRTPAFTGLFNVDPVTFTGPYSQPNKVQPDKNNWGPVAGIAWAPRFDSGILEKLFGNGKSVFRSGYQIGYDSFFNNIASNAAATSPNLLSTSTPSTVDPADPRGLAQLSAALPAGPRALSPLDAQNLVLKNLVNPYYQRWSGGIQRELPWGFLLDVCYVGTKGTRLFINEDLNPLVTPSLRIYPAGYTASSFQSTQVQGRFDPLQGSRLIRTNGGSSTYQAGQLNLSRKLAKDLLMNLAYTRSKYIDNSSDIFGTGGNNLPQQSEIPSIFGGLKNDRSVSLYDRPNRLAIMYDYLLPVPRHWRGLLGQATRGWEVTGVTTIESGAPLSVMNGQDADGLGSNFDRPNFNPSGQAGVRAVPSPTSPTGYVNPDDPAGANTPINPANAMYIGLPACQSATTPCPSGNLGRFTLRTPRTNNFDVSVTKAFSFNERLRMEFRMEAFNIFNHRQYGLVSASAFDQTSSVTIQANVFTSPPGRFLMPGFADGGARVIRYQLKFVF